MPSHLSCLLSRLAFALIFLFICILHSSISVISCYCPTSCLCACVCDFGPNALFREHVETIALAPFFFPNMLNLCLS